MTRATATGVIVLVLLAGLAGLAPSASARSDQAGGCVPPPPRSDPSVPWAQQRLFPERVWPLTRGGGLIVGVVDSGVDGRTPQLAGRVLPGDDVAGNSGRGDADCIGHGTFVAGIVAAGPSPGSGFVGMAPGVRVLPVRVTAATAPSSSSNGDVGFSLSAASIAAGIRRAVDGGAAVVNVSASTDAPDPGLAAAVAYAQARDVVVVASASNGGRTGDPVTYPASYPGVLAVGAVDVTGAHADFSQTGPYLGLTAPGVSVVSIGPGGPGQWSGSGTSYSAPFVTGTVALVRSYHLELTAAAVVHRLLVTADHPAGPMPDPAYGWGMVDPVAAVSAVLPEEHGLSPRLQVGPAPAHSPPPPADESAGPRSAMIVSLVSVVIVVVAVAGGGLGTAGRRRRWRPARVLQVRVDDRPSPPPEEPSPASEMATRGTGRPPFA